MPSTLSHGSYARQFAGEEIANELVHWLNDSKESRERSRIIKIIETAWQLRDFYVDKPMSAIASDVLSGNKTEINKILNLARDAFFGNKSEANKIRIQYQKLLKRYRFFPWILPWSRLSPSMWLPLREGLDKHGAELHPPRYNEFDAVLDLARLADHSLFDKLFRCSCGRWVLARFSHQRFCSAKCREKEFKSSPEARARRREWARKNYRTQRRANVK